MGFCFQQLKRSHVRSAQLQHRHKFDSSRAATAAALQAYRFLAPVLCSDTALLRSIERATHLNVRPHNVLLAEGIVAREAYVSALAQHFGLAANESIQ